MSGGMRSSSSKSARFWRAPYFLTLDLELERATCFPRQPALSGTLERFRNRCSGWHALDAAVPARRDEATTFCALRVLSPANRIPQFLGIVAAAHERPGHDRGEAHGQGLVAEAVELHGRHKPRNGQVVL